MAEGRSPDERMEVEGEGDRNNVSHLFPMQDDGQLDSLRDFTDEQLRSLSAQLPAAQGSLAQLNLDERRPSRVVSVLRQQSAREEELLSSLRQVGRDDIVDMLRPNNVVSLQGAQAASCPAGQDKKRFPHGMLYKNLPYEVRHNFEQKLGVKCPNSLDYRIFGDKIGLQRHTLELLGEDAMSRGTHVMTQWIQQNGRGATVGALHALLAELGLAEVRAFLELYMEGFAQGQ